MIIKSYTNSKQELNLILSRLKIIEERRELLMKESKNIQQLVQNNQICELIEKLKQEKIKLDSTSKCLEEESKELTIVSERIKYHIEKIEESLQVLTGIEYKIYYQVVVKGLNITKAIDKVAMEQDLDPSTLWKYYYPKIKDKINLLKV